MSARPVAAVSGRPTAALSGRPIPASVSGRPIPASGKGPISLSGRKPSVQRPLVIGCGALASELVALTRRAGLPEVDLTCLPATLHNRPEQIPDAVRGRIRGARAAGRDRIFVAYADCGTGGMLDRILDEEGVARLEGAHCYEVYAGRAAFATLAEDEPGTFYLTDFLARNFDRLVIRGLGLDRHPELLPLYFGNYTRVLYLAQTEDAALTASARRGARRLGLRFERRFTGYGELSSAVTGLPVVAAQESRIPAPLEPRAAMTRGGTTVRQRIRRRGASTADNGRRPPAQAPAAQRTLTVTHDARSAGPALAATSTPVRSSGAS